MRRRAFITAAAGTITWPRMLRAQSAIVAPVIGYLNGFWPDNHPELLAAFRDGLREKGYAEGRNLSIEYRWAEGHPERLASLAAALAAKGVSLIVASGGDLATIRAKAAAPSLPIVGTLGGDPIGYGLVQSLSHPGGNVTVVALLTLGLQAKRIEMLRQALPAVSRMAFLDDASYSRPEARRQIVDTAARKLGVAVDIIDARSLADIEPAFRAIVSRACGGVIVSSVPFFLTAPVRDRILALSAAHKLATIFTQLDDVNAGSLLAYGTDIEDVYLNLGRYAARILSGEKPADLPVLQPTRFQFGINLKTAKALDITVPQSLLVQADQVIE